MALFALLVAGVILGVLALLIWYSDKVHALKRSLEGERARWDEERELLAFDLELARAMAKHGTVYLVESADALVDANYWRPHSFFLTRENAESYRQTFDHIPGALTRIREVTPEDLPPTPTERT